MNIHFSLRKQGESDPVIILQVFDSRFKNRKFMYSTGQYIKPADWSRDVPKKGVKKKGQKKTSQVLTGKPKSKASLLPLIEHLRQLENAVIDWSQTKIGSRTLNKSDLKQYLDNLGRDEQKEKQDQLQKESMFFETWKSIIESTKHPRTGKPITDGTIRQKLQTRALVTKYCLDQNFKPTLLNIDLKFYHAFDEFMRNMPLDANTRGRHFKEIKAFLREAVERDYEVNRSFQKKAFKVIREDVDDTYLTITEIKKLKALQLSPRLAVIRDIIVTNCFTGLRHSDWHQVGKIYLLRGEDGKELLRVKQKKTGHYVHIPLHAEVREYLEKYKDASPKIISNQKMNDAIKEICQFALKDENDNPTMIVLNGEPVEKWKACSSHTIRRSFATNCYLSKTLDVYLIMNITGHKTESSFLRYLKLDGQDKARLAAEAKFFADDEWISLKVA